MRKSPFKIISAYVRNDCWISVSGAEKRKKNYTTVKLGFKERLNEEQLGNSEPFSVTNMPVHLTNSEQIGFKPCPSSH